jgi:hypothetical protein
MIPTEAWSFDEDGAARRVRLNCHGEETPKGWRLDPDHWYVRSMRKGDVKFDDCSVGFTHDRVVYLRRAAQCLDYDAGRIAAGDR